MTRSDELILLAVWQLQDEAYGASVHEFLLQETGEDWSIAGVYAPLKRMAKDGLLQSYVSEPLAMRGGRRRRMYSLTKQGVRALTEARRVYESLWTGLPRPHTAP